MGSRLVWTLVAPGLWRSRIAGLAAYEVALIASVDGEGCYVAVSAVSPLRSTSTLDDALGACQDHWSGCHDEQEETAP